MQEPTQSTTSPSRGGFTWPPRPLLSSTFDGTHVQLAPAVSSDHATPHSRLGTHPLHRGLWSSIEETWLGLSTPSFHQRAADAGWFPDEPGDYCPRCASSTAEHEFSAQDMCCPSCRGKRLRWNRAVRLGPYDGLLREAVHQTKFTAWRSLGSCLGRLLGQQLNALLRSTSPGADEHDAPPGQLLIVPIPTTFLRRVSRGIDHTLVISRAVRSVTGGRIVHALSRRHRPSQLSVPPSERAANISNTMSRRRLRGLAGSTVIIIDDVMTSGATMREACRALLHGLPAPARPREIWIAVLGVTPNL